MVNGHIIRENIKDFDQTLCNSGSCVGAIYTHCPAVLPDTIVLIFL